MKYLNATYQRFLQLYPQFDNDFFSDISEYIFDDTYAWAVESWELCTFASRINSAIYLLTAHRLTLHKNAQTNESGQGGKVASASVGEVSVNYEAMPNADKFSYWLSLTPYGLDLLGLLEILTGGVKYYGGTLTRVYS